MVRPLNLLAAAEDAAEGWQRRAQVARELAEAEGALTPMSSAVPSAHRSAVLAGSPANGGGMHAGYEHAYADHAPTADDGVPPAGAFDAHGGEFDAHSGAFDEPATARALWADEERRAAPPVERRLEYAEERPWWAVCLGCLPPAADGAPDGAAGGRFGARSAARVPPAASAAPPSAVVPDMALDITASSDTARAAEEASLAMDEAHRANTKGEYERARRLFERANELAPRATARLSAANMSLKLGDAAGAMEVYLALLSSGAMPAGHATLQRKLREATEMLKGGGGGAARNTSSEKYFSAEESEQ